MAHKYYNHKFDTPNMGVKKHGSNTSALNNGYYTNPRTGFDKKFYKQQANKGTITFGKYSGKNVKDVPVGYLNWLYRNLDHDEHQALIKHIEKIIT